MWGGLEQEVPMPAPIPARLVRTYTAATLAVLAMMALDARAARPRLQPLPEIPSVTRAFDLPDARTELRRQAQSLRSCYDRQVRRGGIADEIRARVQFSIEGDGAPADVRVRTGHVALDNCLDARVSRWRFRPFQGEPVQVQLPLVFVNEAEPAR
jgi:outer membrane biosynthesis protein TonB